MIAINKDRLVSRESMRNLDILIISNDQVSIEVKLIDNNFKYSKDFKDIKISSYFYFFDELSSQFILISMS